MITKDKLVATVLISSTLVTCINLGVGVVHAVPPYLILIWAPISIASWAVVIFREDLLK
jgi:hypothetical protein